MYELINVGENTYYVDSPTKVGIYITQRGAYLIDCGNDKEAGRRLKKILIANNWNLAGIILTHSHADHMGGCAFLQNNYNCPVFISDVEAGFAQHTIFEPALLFGGNPPKDLQHKFLMGQDCKTTSLSSPLFPKELSVISLPGHSIGMTAFRTPDNIIFVGDSVCSSDTISKYKIPYIFDPEKYLTSLAALEGTSASYYIPAHAPVCAEIGDIVSANRRCIELIKTDVVSILEEPLTFDDLTAKLYDKFSLTMTMEQYALTGSTIRGFLTWLLKDQVIGFSVSENKILWHKII